MDGQLKKCFVKDLELIALASESEDWINTVEYLPF
ncbi:hypothetical protein NIVACYA_02282 [Planktothrix agardhii]|jgi:hypothetical protein|uniref:Uncharacterized protein n=1 Tax=Planktothrix agardhii TaxID=1160 RepID=A0AAD1V3F8_PLAAG|nr:hypothetical protein NIES204_33210 [Planktothrix agardhii NIES-204]CAD5939563.1 hypothetical protein NIVACYA_02282 [Planktothrix agardhii]CAD5953555.1 hypothetical protein PANO66_02781 [Planktothrix agardhii]CAD5958210.1 hypothetical protein NO2A_03467 [Planktothrix agardhii]CAD5962639.1 hypothetical protein PCC7811_03259 [Planktothrix agardhii]